MCVPFGNTAARPFASSLSQLRCCCPSLPHDNLHSPFLLRSFCAHVLAVRAPLASSTADTTPFCAQPTKDRAKKPRKGKSVGPSAPPTKSAPSGGSTRTLASIREASPPRVLAQPSSSTVAPAPAEQKRAALAVSPPQIVVAPVQTASPVSQYPSPPATRGRALPPIPTPAPAPAPVPFKPPVATKPAVIDTAPRPPMPGAKPVPFGPARTPSAAQDKERPPPSPVRTRIPSTGNRARVMDVAQAFEEEMERQGVPTSADAHEEAVVPKAAAVGISPAEMAMRQAAEAAREEEEAARVEERMQAEVKAVSESEDEEYSRPNVKDMIANWGPRSSVQPAHGTQDMNGAGEANGTNGTARASGSTVTITAPPMEKRKSSYERYSAFVLPPLQEERTPVSSPAGTLRRDAAPDVRALAPQEEEAVVPKAKASITVAEVVESVKVEVLQPKTAPREEVVHLGESR